MNHLLSILLAAILCASTSAQSIRTLGYNSTNGAVVANTGTNVLTFTNDVSFGNGDLTVSGQVISGGGVSFSFEDGALIGEVVLETNSSIGFQGASAATTRANLGFPTNLNTLWTATNASNARSAVGLGATWLTNDNVTNFRTAIGLGATDTVTFGSGLFNFLTVSEDAFFSYAEFASGTNSVQLSSSGIVFTGNTAAATRANLSLGLPALTNTSNITAMRALSGSTNTNHPYSGSISVTGTNNTNTLVFSNGILQSVQ